MNHDRSLARIAGILYLVTFATSIPALALKTPLLDDGIHPDLAVWGALLEIVLAFACVVSRTLEAGLILVGVLCILSLAKLPGNAADAALRALHGWTFLLGPAVM